MKLSRLRGPNRLLAVCLALVLIATMPVPALPVTSAGDGPKGADGGVEPPAELATAPEPPAKPAGLTVGTAVGSLDVSVDWDDVEGASSYLVRWRVAGPGNSLNEGVETQSSDAEITVADYGEWVARVQACNDAGCGSPAALRFAVEPAPEPTPTPAPEPTPEPVPEPSPAPRSEPEPATAPEPPAKPAGLTVGTAVGSLDVSVDWDDVEGASSYRVRWRVAGSGNKLNDGVEVQSSGAEITVDGDGMWVVRVEACNDAGCGSPASLRFAVEPAPEVEVPPYFPAAASRYTFTQDEDIGTVTLPEAAGGAGGFTYGLAPTLPEGLSFDSAGRSLTGTPAEAGDHAMTYTATDSDGTQVGVSFTIAILGTAAQTTIPTPDGLRVERTTFDEPTDPALDVSWTAVDTEGVTITGHEAQYRKKAAEGEDPAEWTAYTGSLSATATSLNLPDLEAGATYEVQVRVVADEGDGPWSDTGEGMANRPPVASGVSFLGGTLGMGGKFAWHEQAPLGSGPFFSDPEGDALTYSASAEHAALVGVSLSGAAGSSVLTANLLNQGASKVFYTASDPYGGEVTREASLTVTAKTGRDILEGSPAGTAVGAPVTGTPYNNVALAYTLEGKAKDSGLFVIDSASGQISVAEGAVFDYDAADGDYRETETWNGQVIAKFYRGEVHYTVDGHASVINVIIRVQEREFGKPGTPTLSRTEFSEPTDPALDVSWSAADDNGLVITGYEARYRKKAAAWTDYTGALSATASSLNLPGLEAGATYEVEVRAVGRKSGAPDITLSVNPASFGENALSDQITVTATRQGSSGAVTVDLALLDGTATSGTDYSVWTLPDITIADGSTSGSADLTFTAVRDTDVEGSESIIVSGTADTGASVGNAIITIIDDEQPGPVITGVKTGPWSDTGEGMANRPPVASGVSFLGGTLGMGGKFAWHEQAPLGSGPFFSDPEGDALTYSASAEHAALVGVSLSGAAGSSVLTANLLNQGASKVFYTASDPYGGEVTREASLTVTAKTSRDILEGSPAGTAVGAPVAGTPYNGVALSYTLEGKAKDSGLFVIDSGTGQISVAEGAVLDYDAADGDYRETETHNGQVIAKFYRGEVHYTVDSHDSVINVLIRVNERKPGKPGAPSLSRTEFSEPTDPALDATWTAADDNGLVITGYEAQYRKKAAQGETPAEWTAYTGALSATASSLNLPGLDAGATYEVQVRARARKSSTPDITLSVNPVSLAEPTTSGSVTVTATRQGTSGAVTVDLAVPGGTATDGTDSTALTLPDITIPDGSTSGTADLTFTIWNDELVEGSESIILSGTADTGATVGNAIITILDDEQPGPVITGVKTGPWSDTGQGMANRPPVASGVSFLGGTLGMGGKFAWHEQAPLGTGPFFSDPDEDTLTYSASAEHAALVGVSLSGAAGSSVLTANLLNQGASKVSYVASDAYGGQVTRSASLTVTAKTSRDILEGSPAGTAVGDPVTGTPYNNVALSYTLKGKAKDSGLFVIDSGTGQISVAEGAVLDYYTDDTHREIEMWRGEVFSKFYRGEVHYTVDGHDSVINVLILVNERKFGKPGAPSLSRTEFSEPSDPALDVSWTAADDNGLTITGYEAQYRKKAAQGETPAEWTDFTGALSATASSLNLPGLDAGATYEVQVRAVGRKSGTPDITLSVNPVSLAEPTASGSVTVTATRQGTSGDVTVDLALSGGTATSGTDYTVQALPDITIADGSTSGSATLTFTISDDTDVEGSESIIVSGTATGATVGDAIITIIDDERAGPVITGVRTGPWSDVGEGTANSPPVASGVDFLGGTLGMGGSFAWHEAAPLGAGAFFSDPDDDALTYSASAEHAALVGVSLSGAAGSAVLTASLLNQGASKVSYVASDAYGGQVTRTASLTVTGKTSREILEGSPAGTAVGAPVTGTPYNGVALSYVLKGKAKDSGLFVIDAASGQISVAEGAVLDYHAEDGDYRETETYNGQVIAKFYRGEVHYTVDGHDSVINVLIKVKERKFGKPDAPTLSRTEFSEPTDPALDATWTAADDNGLVITGYEARYRKKAAQGESAAAWTDYTRALSATASSLNLPGLEGGATYEAQVRAVGRTSGTPDITLSVNPVSLAEPTTAGSVTVTATRQGTSGAVTVDLALSDGTATDGTDYTAQTLPDITIADGSTSGTANLTFTISDDTDVEGSESIIVSGTATGATVGDAIVTIIDDERVGPVITGVRTGPWSDTGEGTANRPPVASGVFFGGGTAGMGGSFAWHEQAPLGSGAFFSDADGDALTYSASAEHAALVGVSLSGAAGSSVLTADLLNQGASKVSYTASDGYGGQVTRTASITVTAKTVRDILEGSPAGTAVGAPVTGTPYNGVALSYVLKGKAKDSGLFVIDSASGQISVAEGAVLDYDTDDTHREIETYNGEVFAKFYRGEVHYTVDGHDSVINVLIRVQERKFGKPGAPTLTRTEFSEPSDPALDAAWTAADDNGLVITGYEAQYRKKAAQGENAAGWTDYTGALSATATSLNLPGLEAGATYEVQVRARGRTAVTPDISLSVNPASFAESATSEGITVTATRQGSSGAVTVDLALSGGTATSTIDYSVSTLPDITIADGNTSGSATLTFTGMDDALAEGSESIIVTGTATGATVGRAIITIIDDERAGPVITGVRAGPWSDVGEGMANRPPVASSVSFLGGTLGTGGSFTWSETGSGAFFSDPEGDALTYSASAERPALVGVTLSGTAGSAVLTANLLNQGASEVSYVAGDAYGGQVTRTASITVTAKTSRDVLDGSPAGTAVGTPVTGTPYNGVALSYTLKGKAKDSGLFVIDSGTGQISVAEGAVLDYHTDDTHRETETYNGEVIAKFYRGEVHYTVDGHASVINVLIRVNERELGKPGEPSLTRTEFSEPTDPALDATWTAADDNGLVITGYEAQYRKKAAQGEDPPAWTAYTGALSATATSLNLPGLEAGATYEAQVRAVGRISGTPDIALSVNPVSLAEPTTSGSVTVTATRQGSSGAVTVDLALSGGTATSGTDYSVGTLPDITIADGSTSGSATLTFTISDDQLVEGSESIIVTGTATGVSVGDAIITIIDDERAGPVITGVRTGPWSDVGEGTANRAPAASSVSFGGGSLGMGGSFAWHETAPLGSGAFFSDPDGDALTYSASAERPALVRVSLSGAAGSAVLTANLLNQGASKVLYVASDAYGGQVTRTASLTVTAKTSREITEGSPAGTAVGDPVTGTPYNNVALSYTLKGKAKDSGLFVIDSGTGQISVAEGAVFDYDAEDGDYRETETHNGQVIAKFYRGEVHYTVNGHASVINVIIKLIENSPPVITDPGDKSYVQGTSITAFDIEVSDVDGDTVTVTVTGLPDGLSYDATTKKVSGTVARSATVKDYTATISADDGTNTAVTETFTVTVTSAPTGVTLSAVPSSLGEDDGETSVTVTATFAGGTLPGSTVVTIGTLSGSATKDTDYTVGTSLGSITISANSASGSGIMKITPTDDQVVEGDETITIPGSTTTAVGLSVASASVTLTDDDKTTTETPDDKDSAVLSISGPASAVAEGSDASFTVTLSAAIAAQVEVAWSAPKAADAAVGSDLSATSGTVTFAAGSAAGATQTITITATDDNLSETSEGFTVTLGTITSTLSEVSLKSGASSATATISESDPITINITGPSSVDEGDATGNYTVSLSPSGVTPTADLTVSYGTANGTATAGTDYTAKSGTLTFTSTAAGSQTFSVQTTEDVVDEGTGETFTVSISSPSGGGGPAPSLATSVTVTTTITDDDDAPSGITLSAVPSSLGEDDGETSVTVTATLNGSTLPSPTTVTIGTLSGGATKGTDYTVGTALASITIPANTASGSGIMKITPTDDAVVEGDETITIPGSTSNEVGLSVTSASVTLTDDDKTTTETPDDKDSAVLSISGPGSPVAEGSDASFTVTLSKSVAAEVKVAWSAPLGTDSAEGADLSATSGTVTFAAGSAAGATQTITITATDDALSETAETLTVTLGTITSTLSSQLGLKNGASSATATISASDPITVNISGPSSVDEGGATTNYTVSLSPAGVTPTSDLTVSYGTAAGTATSGTDFTAKSGTLTFTQTAAGSQTFTVQTTEDNVDEGTGETFTVSISSPSGGGGPTPSLNTSATVTTTITDDDDASGITLSASPSSLGEDDGETSVTVTATLNGSTLPGSTTVTIGTVSGSATKDTDYTVGTSLASITIPANTASGTGTMKITPTDDAVVEGDESITIPGSTSTEVGLSVTSATVTLTDDDKTTTGTPDDKDSAVLSISGPSAAVAEGSEASFTVTLSKSVAAEVKVAWSAPLGTDAAEGSDLSATSGTVTFAANSAAGATKTITITAIDDKLSETAETFTVTLGTITSTLSSQLSLASSAKAATATISASDPITVSISGPSAVDEGDATTNYTVSLSPAGVTPTSDLTVSYGTAAGTATSGTDFTAKSGTLTFTSTAAGSQTFSVQTTEDDVDEGTGETFTVSISSPSGGGGPAPSLGTSASVTTTITDDDDVSGITLSAVPSSLGEDDGETSVTVTATLAGATLPGSTTVTIGTLSGGATKGTDYTATTLSTITIPATSSSGTGTLKITPTDDAVVEGDETITIPGSTTTAVGLSVTSATVTLTDDDKTTTETPDDKDSAVLSISGPASAVAEGSDASFTVTLSKSVAAEVKVGWSAPLSTDGAEGSDLSATSGTVTFAANSSAGATKTITITATDDKLSETAEGFTVTLGTITSTLSSQVGLKNGASSATATISASDPITVNIIGPSSVDEGDATTNYTVSLSPSGVTPTADLTVSYGTADGTAVAGTDYTAKSGTLTFTQTAAGSQTFTVQTTEDNVDEGTGETFTVSISSPSGGGGPTPSLNTSATVTTTITDDDDASGITLSAVPSSLGEDDGETSVTVTATLNGSVLPGSTTVTIGTLSGGATRDTDYTVGTSLASITIPANTASGTGIMKITPTDDAVVEGDETITIPGSTTTAVGLSVTSATVTLTDDDKTTTGTPDDKDSAVLSISGPASAVAEGSGASFTVTLSKSVAAQVQVGWSAPLNTDSAVGSDLSATSGTVTFAANSAAGATQTITITATDDKLSETAETFTVTLGTITSTLSSQISLASSAKAAAATISASDPITVNISGPSAVDEGDATTNYTVSLSPSGVTPTADLTVSYGTAGGTATSGTDFTAKSGTLTFTQTAAGSQTFAVQTTEDDVDEGTGETFTVSISSPSGGGGPAPSLATSASVTTTISDDDDVSGITLSASPSSLGEDDGETSVTVTATLAGGTLPGSTVVTIGTLSGGATKDTDYTVGTSLASITIPATSSSGTGTLVITPTDDAVVEGDESITIPGSTTTAVGLSVASASVTLTDDDKTTTETPDDKDSAVLSISGPASAVAEGSDASFTVTLSKSVAAKVQLAWSAPLAADAAVAADLSATSGTVTFAANSAAGATQTITIGASDDKLSETSEGFTVTLGTITSTLSSQVGLKNGASSATATISASDPITVNISGPSSVDEGDATTNYTVSLSPSGVIPTADLTVSYGTANGTATAGTDFTAKSGTLTFTSTAAGSQTFSVQTTEDDVDEGTGETFTVSISSPSGGGGPAPSLNTSATVTTTISDDDDASGITLSASPSSLGEDDGETSVTVTATLAGGTLPGSTTVTIGTLSGSATKGTDYSVGTSLASITIPANTASGTGTLVITPTDDAVVEGDETITIPGSTTTAVGLSVASASVTLTDDDKTTTEAPDDKDSAVLSISGPASAVAEGSDASFTVTLSAAIAAKVDVAWSAPLSTDAAEGSDLSATSGTVTFAAGSAAGATQTITITATDDKLSETAETFTVTLGTITSTLSEVSLKSGASSATATISASDAITVNISGPSTVDEGDATGNYTVSLSPSGVTPTSDLTVNYATANGTATAGTDYTAKSGTLTFTSAAAGSQTFKVQTTEDVVDEGTGETFTVSISSPSGGGGPAPSLAKSPTVTTTITDDDDAPSGVTLSAVPSSLGEDDAETSLTVTAKLNGSTLPGSTTVTIGTLSGSATKDTDYTVGTSLASITIPATTASWSGTMKITPTDDTVVEGDETITIPGSTTTAVGLSVTSATVTLTDSRKAPLGNPNDEPPAGSPGDTDGAVLSISGPASAVAEGSDASFTVTLSAAVAAEVKVAWSAPLAADAAVAADLSATSGTVTFAANSAAGATKTIKITATDDKLSETSEGFTVTLGTITSTLSSQISLKSGASSATATISASDAITVNISGPSSVDEGDSTTSYTVSLSPTGVTPTADLTVSYGTANGTATAGTDYTAKSGTLTFTSTAAGSQTFKVQTTEDDVDEGTGETFTVSISSPSGGGGPTPSLNTSASVTTTITDDDDAPSGITLSAVPSSLGEDDGETSVTVTATLNGSTLPGSTVVTIGTLSGGATKDTDYTVGTSLASITIPATSSSGTGTLVITPTDDAVVEGDESITIPGSTTTEVGLSVASASVTLTDDDKTTTGTPDDKDSAVLSISGPSAAVAEGSDAEFVVTLSKSVAAEVSVGWSAPLGTDAAEGSDLSATSGTVTFAANSAAGATETITITATDDRLSETSEGFTVTLGTITSTLSSQISLRSGATSATATISESDPITVSLSGSSSVTEGDSSSYTITLTPQGVIPTADLLVDYTTADGTASAGEDYVAKSGTLTFTRTDAAAKTVTITTIADAVEEGDETFSLTITNPRGGGGPPPAVNTTVTTNIRERPDPTEPATPTPESGTVPEVADVDPTPDYTPTFDACVNAASEPWGFVDVPAEHPNADDIHCIAYYGITIGTGDGSTYSPSGFVPRWQVALFLTRMARRVGIEVPATPDIGFTDIGDLAYGTQASIKQLMALGITRGTTPTTYAPHDVVTRGQMALFIARLMNLVTPLTDGDPAMDDTTFYGYTPSLVAKNEEVKVRDEHGLDVAPEIKSPYTDVGSIGGDMYSAITQLYELGVVTGLTSTTFGSSDLITRASTAEFLAGALAHSNVRPAGLSIQADNTADYGEYVATMLISVRDDEFGPVTDGLVDIFQNNCADICGEDAHFITSGTRAGRCNGRQTVGDCVWGTDDHKTDRNGNIHFEARIGATPAVEGTTSRTHTVYAWIGSEPGDVFDLDDDDYVSAAASWIPVRDSVAVTTSISSDSADGMDRTTTGAPTDSGKLVHLGSTRSVVVTGQLTDSGGGAVKQGGVGIRVSWTRYVFDRGPDGADAGDSFVITYENIHEATRTTSDDGTVTFTVSAPKDVESAADQDVVDMVMFTVDADGKTDGTANTMGTITFNWVEDTPVYQKTAISATEYVLVDGDGDGDDADISVSARLLDQYGEGIRLDDNGNAYRITLALDGNGSEHFTDIDPDTPGVQTISDVVKTPSIRSGSSSRGMAAASFSVNDIARTTHSLDIAYRIARAQVDSEGLLVDGDPHTDGVQIIYQSLTGATASGTTAATNVYVAATDGDGDDRKITVHQTFGGNLADEIPATHFATEGNGADHGVLYAMDDNDTYINNGESAPPCVAFRPQAGDVVRVVVYSRDKDGASIYDITPHRQLGVTPL